MAGDKRPVPIREWASDKLDERASEEEPFRSERLRELVDNLPPLERRIVERHFFGQASFLEVLEELQEELGVREAPSRDVLYAKRDRALKLLREAVLEDRELREMCATRFGFGAVLEPSEME